ncbi:hypothetical protein TNCV_2106631 [Trichonephila clavipes]|nr:hypothetical protein TNCV_2106631 [Trichonephila clavipes]
MFIAKTKRIGNRRPLYGIGDSDDINQTRGNRMISPLNFTVKIFASRSFLVSLLMKKHVPSHNLGGFKLHSKITSEPIYNRRLSGGIPDISREFKNSAGKFTVLFSSTIVSIDLKGIGSPGNNSISRSLFR